VAGKFAFSVAGANQYAPSAGTVGEFDVKVAIANHKGTAQVQGMLASRAFEHSEFRLSAIAAVGWSVRAIVNAFDTRTGGCKPLGHELVDSVHKRLGKIAAADAGLIGDDDNGQPGFIEAANGSRDKWKHTKSAQMIQVTNFFGDGTVAIDEDGGTAHSWLKQGAPRKAGVEPRIPP
jgi:hypothetical protein